MQSNVIDFSNHLEALRYASESGIINFEDICQKINDMKTKEYLQKHSYSIWQGKNDKKWYTYLPDKNSERGFKRIKRTTREAIEQDVVKYWKEQEKKKEVVTFRDAYWFWRSKHDEFVCENSVAKYQTEYKRFFENSKFEKMNLKSMVDDDIRLFMVQTIKNNRLTKETSRRLLGYIANTIATARKYKIITENPVEFIKSSEFNRHCYEKERTAESEIMSLEELTKLQKQIDKDHETKPNYIPSYAVEMAMLTGMRVAEVSALRWDRITDTYIIIDSSEKTNPSKTEFWIDKTKTGKVRFFPIDDEIRKLLETVKKVQKEYGYDSEFVFANANGRIHGKTISACIKTKCRQAKIKERGIYALRKTFNSNMRCNGVSVVVASQLLGHSIETNNKYYTFDNTTLDEKNKIVTEINAKIKGTQGNTVPNAANF